MKSNENCDNVNTENDGESEVIEILDECDTIVDDVDNVNEVEHLSTDVTVDKDLSNESLIKDKLVEDLLQDSDGDEELLQESHSVIEELGETLFESSNLLSNEDSSKTKSD